MASAQAENARRAGQQLLDGLERSASPHQGCLYVRAAFAHGGLPLTLLTSMAVWEEAERVGYAALIELGTPPPGTRCTFLGDLHGDVYSAAKAFREYLRARRAAEREGRPLPLLILLGDYVDRGPQQLEVLQLLFALVLCYGVKLAPARGAAASGVAALRGNHEAPIHAGESLAPAPGGSRRRQLAHEVVGHLVEGVRARKEAELAAMAAVVAQDDAEKRRQLEEADTRGLPPPRIEGWERTEAGTWARTVYYPAIDGGDFDVQAAREAGQVARFLASESCPDMTEHGWGGKAVRGTLPRLDELRGRVEARLAAGQLPNLKDCLAALYGGLAHLPYMLLVRSRCLFSITLLAALSGLSRFGV
ncbi:hypothetical protein MNEG_10499 [Monoraphidium neglectum]|uniref:Calcineurin-like phosphoesterase domain-containing protein n=1 Tax=Monoraphidium neglectum TaxID=145388 RepID=A0A0D2JCR3_9CHLO|nr:hypothetical protein MNEG_10499 [Monoraphidium neglectum]KIY97462.1 hypothetical protein MNEG_10499 [Monoraphidium neglectum]|eukprot:XP_013896482.1 hypothetical protein MNEG_10499 [Monoraphidium neglectum]